MLKLSVLLLALVALLWRANCVPVGEGTADVGTLGATSGNFRSLNMICTHIYRLSGKPGGGAGRNLNQCYHWISQLKSLLHGSLRDLVRVIESYPDNYANSTTTNKNINGTVIQTNTTITKNTKNNHTSFLYSERNKVLSGN